MTDLFVYGTLRPGQVLWPMIHPAVQSFPLCTLLRGYALLDSGHHYPYLVRTDMAEDVVRGTLLNITLDNQAARKVFRMEYGAGYMLDHVNTDAGPGVAFTWPGKWTEQLPYRRIGKLRVHDFALYRERLGYPPDESAQIEK